MNRHSYDDFFKRKYDQLGVVLNEVQKKAVLHNEGPLLLLASPGSGKTTTTIMRIGYLIEEIRVNPARIKAVSFSRASAIDMNDRFKRFFPEHPINSVDFSTIHSLAFQVVREYFYRKGISYQLIEGNAVQNGSELLHKKHILRNLFKKIVGENITEDQAEELSTYISFIKNKLIPKEKWSKVKCDVPNAKQILLEYEENKKISSRNLLVDYDDMLTIANEAFENDQNLLQKYQQKFDYMLTDESQDTSLVQHYIIEKLVKNHQNLFVVADDDQSIYSWRGAEPEYLINFKEVYPNSKILKMEQNYRSTSDIVTVANQFIKQNKNRYDKNMFTENPPHKPVQIKRFKDYKNQTIYLVDEIAEWKNLQDIAILYRNNSSLINLVNQFDRAKIPFYLKDYDNRFFSHWVVKDIKNFMRLAFNNTRIDIFEQIYTKFNFYITKQQMSDLKRQMNNRSVFENLLLTPDLKSYQIKQIEECQKLIKSMREMPPLQAIQLIRNQLIYDETIKTICKKLGFKEDYLIGILLSLEEISESLETIRDFANRLTHLESLVKASKYNKDKNAVTFTTFHSSKGLEFKKVYMIDLINGIIPSHEEIKQDEDGNREQMEEAVRLFYVGMTRAELDLELLTYKTQYGKNVGQSLFVSVVENIISPPKIIQKVAKIERPTMNNKKNVIKNKEDLKIGSIIKHRVFGHGEILQLSDEKIVIQFPKVRKELLISLCIEMGLLEETET